MLDGELGLDIDVPISSKALIVGHHDISDGTQCDYLARRVVASLIKTTDSVDHHELWAGVNKWLRWTLDRYGPGAGEDGCVICCVADHVYKLQAANDKHCGHRYWAQCLPRWLAQSFTCAFCRQQPINNKHRFPQIAVFSLTTFLH